MFNNIRRRMVSIKRYLRSTMRAILPTRASNDLEDELVIRCYDGKKETFKVIPKCTKRDLLLPAVEITCEDVCNEIAETLHISPAALPLFSLSTGSYERDGTGPLWLSPDDHIMKYRHEEIYFRLRYLPVPKKCESLKELDETSLQYIYWQMLLEYLSDKLELNESESMGITVLCIMAALRKNTEECSDDGVEVVENLNNFLNSRNIGDYLPQSFDKSNPLQKFLRLQRHRRDTPIKNKIIEHCKIYPPGKVQSTGFMLAFLKHVLIHTDRYYREKYTVFRPDSTNIMIPVCVEIQMNSLRPRITVKPTNSAATMMESEWFIENLSSLEVMEQEIAGCVWRRVMIISEVGIPEMLYFEREPEMKSFVTCLEGYYRLTVDYYQSLVPDMQPALLRKMQTLRAFGPVSSECLNRKLNTNVYILRSSTSKYNEFDVVYKQSIDGELIICQLGKVLHSEEGYKMDGASEWVPDIKKCIHSAIKQLGVLGTRERLRPQSDVCDLLSKVVTLVNPIDVMNDADSDDEISSLPRVYSSSDVKVNRLLGQGYFTEVLAADLHGCNLVVKRIQMAAEQLCTIKALKEGMNKHLTEFAKEPKHFIGLVGLSLSPTDYFIQQRAEFGSLQAFLQRRQSDRPLFLDHLMNVAIQVAVALLYMEEKVIYHGNLHCGNVLVVKYDRHEMGVKLADPGSVSLYNQMSLLSDVNRDRIPWLAPELFARFSHSSIKSDIYAYSTTLWQMFSNGARPRDHGQQLNGWSATQMIQFYKSGKTLSCPSFLLERADDPRDIHTIKTHLFDLMTSCWKLDREERPSAKSIVKSLLTLSNSYGGTYHNYNVIPELQRLSATPGMSATSVNNYPLDVPTSDDTAHYMSARRAITDSAHRDLMSLVNSSFALQPQHSTVASTMATAATPTPTPTPTTTTTTTATVRGTIPGSQLVNIGTNPPTAVIQNRAVNRNPVMGLGTSPSLPMATPPNVKPVVSNVRHMIPENRLNIHQNVVLGKGHYGVVYKGQLQPLGSSGFSQPQDVAVKVMKREMADRFAELFKREIHVNEALDHKNIVKFYGVCRNGEYIVMEYVARGALITYLASCFRDKVTISPAQMLRFCVDVATGMEYLSSNRVIHCDLAARNILLTSDLIAKVADFGLSKVLSQDTDYYRRKDDGRTLPIYWCAPEWIGHQRRVMVKSDVWSYGIVMWECYSYGRKPNICATDEAFKNEGMLRLSKGERLKQPTECPNDLYGLMNDCWKYDADKRPTFTQCLNRLNILQPLDDKQGDSRGTPLNHNTQLNTSGNLAKKASVNHSMNSKPATAALSNSTDVSNAANQHMPTRQSHDSTANAANGSRAQLTNGSRPKLATNGNAGKLTNGSLARSSNISSALSTNGSRARSSNRSTAPSSMGTGFKGSHTASSISGDYSKAASVNHVTINKDDIQMSDLLGKGGYGCVYKASYHGNQVAVKCFSAHPDDFHRFHREMDLLYSCDDENIIKFIGMFGQTDKDKMDAYVMEYMENGTMKSYLAECLKSRSPVGLHRKLNFLLDIAKGMEYLSLRKILHCDLTAVNVLLTAKLTAKISDLGWAKELTGDELDGTYCRKGAKIKPLWHALEVFQNKYNLTTDVWSYGVVALEVFLDGGDPKLPKPTDPYTQLQAGVRFGRPSGCPEDVFENILSQCWQRLPADRPTFADLVKILRELLQNLQDTESEMQNKEDTDSKIPTEDETENVDEMNLQDTDSEMQNKEDTDSKIPTEDETENVDEMNLQDTDSEMQNKEDTDSKIPTEDETENVDEINLQDTDSEMQNKEDTDSKIPTEDETENVDEMNLQDTDSEMQNKEDTDSKIPTEDETENVDEINLQDTDSEIQTKYEKENVDAMNLQDKDSEIQTKNDTDKIDVMNLQDKEEVLQTM